VKLCQEEEAKPEAPAPLLDQSRQVDAIESKRADGRGHRHEGGVRQAARELGKPESTIRRDLKIAGHGAGGEERSV
jgi:hypothetical protein